MVQKNTNSFSIPKHTKAPASKKKQGPFILLCHESSNARLCRNKGVAYFPLKQAKQ